MTGNWSKNYFPMHKKAFPGHNLSSQSSLFRRTGFKILEEAEAYCPITFYDTGALVWFAKIIEWEFADFSVDRCFNNLLAIENEINQKGFVSGNIHRFYLVARK